MSRPSTKSIAAFALDEQLLAAGVRVIFNTQEPGEHPFCGEPLVAPGAFTYLPSQFEAAGIRVHVGGWPDLWVPKLAHVNALVAVASGVLSEGGRIAVHCHAGFGRTGVLIACVLLHRHPGLTGDEAIALVRARRRKCIQNKRQVNFVRGFAAARQVDGTPSPPGNTQAPHDPP